VTTVPVVCVQELDRTSTPMQEHYMFHFNAELKEEEISKERNFPQCGNQQSSKDSRVYPKWNLFAPTFATKFEECTWHELWFDFVHLISANDIQDAKQLGEARSKISSAAYSHRCSPSALPPKFIRTKNLHLKKEVQCCNKIWTKRGNTPPDFLSALWIELGHGHETSAHSFRSAGSSEIDEHLPPSPHHLPTRRISNATLSVSRHSCLPGKLEHLQQYREIQGHNAKRIRLKQMHVFAGRGFSLGKFPWCNNRVREVFIVFQIFISKNIITMNFLT